MDYKSFMELQIMINNNDVNLINNSEEDNSRLKLMDGDIYKYHGGRTSKRMYIGKSITNYTDIVGIQNNRMVLPRARSTMYVYNKDHSVVPLLYGYTKPVKHVCINGYIVCVRGTGFKKLANMGNVRYGSFRISNTKKMLVLLHSIPTKVLRNQYIVTINDIIYYYDPSSKTIRRISENTFEKMRLG